MAVLPRPLSPGAGMRVTTERSFARHALPGVHPGMALLTVPLQIAVAISLLDTHF